MKSILIKNAQVVLGDGLEKTNVLIRGSKVVSLDPAAHSQADEVVDADGLFLLPGIVDPHVHFREPGLTHKEDFAHASRAAAKGGVTSFLEMPNTNPTTTTCQRLEEKLQIASQNCFVNYGFYIGATTSNLEELKAVRRTPGIKIFIGSSTGDMLVDNQETLEQIFAETTLPICAHCEDESTVRANQIKYADRSDVAAHSQVRDYNAAIIATRRAIDLATRHQHQFHVLHISTRQELGLIRDAPPWVTGEVCPHHLFFSVDDYSRLGALIKMNPSVKGREDNESLWNALLDGTLSIVATDHAPHTMDEKRLPYPKCPSGMPAVENSLALMLDQVNRGKCTLCQVVRWMCSEPARIWHLAAKGVIAKGADADLVLVDLNLRQTVDNATQQTKCGWSPWHGQTLQGWAVRTWVMGHEVYRLVDGRPVFDATVPGTEIHFDDRPSPR